MVSFRIIHEGPNVSKNFAAGCGVSSKCTIGLCLMFSKFVLIRGILFNIIECFLIVFFNGMLGGLELESRLGYGGLQLFAVIQGCFAEDMGLESSNVHNIIVSVFDAIKLINQVLIRGDGKKKERTDNV